MKRRILQVDGPIEKRKKKMKLIFVIINIVPQNQLNCIGCLVQIESFV